MSVQRCGPGRRSAWVWAAAAAAVAAAPLYAAPVLWVNPPAGQPDHFDWGVAGTLRGLDLTRGPREQPAAAPGPAVFDQFVHATDPYSYVVAQSGGSVEVGGEHDWFLLPQLPTGGPWGGFIPSGAPWSSYGLICHPDLGSLLPEGRPAYVGVWFHGDDGTHYAWIGVERSGAELEAFAWCYETEAGIPVCYPPEPGTLSLLAFSAALVAARRGREVVCAPGIKS